MFGIVYQRDKRSGSTYAYQDRRHFDPETGRLQTRREYLGRVDPETGEIVPKFRGRRQLEPSPGDGASSIELAEALRDRDEELGVLRRQVVSLMRRNAELEDAFAQLSALFSKVNPDPGKAS